MQNSFNNPQSSGGAICSLCQDKLLRHISQSRVFWYCPSCRQEMVSERQSKPAARAGEIIQHRKANAIKVVDYSKEVSVKAS